MSQRQVLNPKINTILTIYLQFYQLKLANPLCRIGFHHSLRQNSVLKRKLTPNTIDRSLYTQLLVQTRLRTCDINFTLKLYSKSLSLKRAPHHQFLLFHNKNPPPTFVPHKLYFFDKELRRFWHHLLYSSKFNVFNVFSASDTRLLVCTIKQRLKIYKKKRIIVRFHTWKLPNK